ncbi:histidinol dehydrogenase [Mesonia sp. MT50]|uniref:Histidinol dehydrogenase n=1 Tax=Mesonia profundi TaxID=3070998 RepID=A0ABU1A3M1_9FLAO|nr:histidinol dehydrogenase [Mesonia profundi]MDQ7918320.1 histidinol dehydrogenase [Mesonia profundi]
MHIIKNPSPKQWPDLLKRPTQSLESIETKVEEVFKEVSAKGDQAILKYTQLFDGVALSNFKVTPQEIEEAKNLVPQELQQAIQQAKENITKFHAAQRTKPLRVETQNGVECWQEKRPIQKVGLYIPGGSAPLFSTILMLAIPANLAGCQEIVLCSPPNKEGKLDPAILYTANLCGVTNLLKVGGIQAIAGMTFGTESIPQVYKIFGPGNQFVTVAKQLATKYNVAIDMPAGPSELLVFADETAKANFVASDLLSQAEHGADSQVILVTTSEKMLQEVEKEVKKQLESLPRKQMTAKAIQNSKLILMNTEKSALALINAYAPEHFIVVSKNEDFFINGIQNAGSVFIGNYTPESAGDYASGTNHTLPTNGFAKQYSGVNLDSFLKSMTFQKIDATGIKNLGKTIELMAEAEGLHAHKNAVSLRLKSLE